jgi:hypothetical protein
LRSGRGESGRSAGGRNLPERQRGPVARAYGLAARQGPRHSIRTGHGRAFRGRINSMPDTTEPTETQLAGDLARLREEHRDLDTAINALEAIAAADQLQIQRLKKRKLWLKDRIIALSDQLTPDIIA